MDKPKGTFEQRLDRVMNDKNRESDIKNELLGISNHESDLIASESKPESDLQSDDHQVQNGRTRSMSQLVRDVANKLSVFNGDHYSRWAREAKRVLVLIDFVVFMFDYADTAKSKFVDEDQAVATYLEAHIAKELKNEMTVR